MLIGMQSLYSQTVETTITPTIDAFNNTYQALLYKPDDYATNTSAKYPLIMFLHGAGEASGGLSAIYNSSSAGGPAYFIEHSGWPSSFTNPVDSQTYKFLVVSPQAAGSGWSSTGPQLDYMIRYMVANYRVDTNRIYITGLSAGGAGVVQYAIHSDDNGNPYTPRYKIAAMVPMSEAFGEQTQAQCNVIVADSTRAWGFGSPTDTHGVNTETLISHMNTAAAGFGRFTSYSGGHCCWGTFYVPTYKETINGKSMNIYEWMLTKTRSLSTTPTANAGTNQTITLPVDSVTLSGSGTAGAGHSITSYGWSQVSGPNTATFTSSSSASTRATGLVHGVYVFRLTVTNNASATATSNVTITVNAAPAPTANAGANQTITLPTSSVTLNGSGSTGTITSYSWTKISGPGTPTLTSPTSVSTTVTGLTAGSYIFQLAINGSIDSSRTTVTVLAATTNKYVKVNLYGGSNPYTTGGWNNWNITSTTSSGLLKYSTGDSSVITVTTNYLTSVVDNGTGYPTTMCPPEVGRYASFASDIDALFTITGLDSSKTYDIETYNTRNNSHYVTDVSIGAVTRVITTDTNYSHPASFSGLQTSTGTIVITLHREGDYHYINGFQITEVGSSGSAPNADAGANQTITLPTSSVTLNGSGSSGTITSYSWTKISGPGTPTITSPTSVSTVVTGLTEGSYIFQLVINGGVDTSLTTVTVNPATSNKYVKVNLYGGANPYTTGGWNNWNITSTTSSGLLKYSTGDSSTITVTTNYLTTVVDNGTGYLTTMCPPEVGRYASYASDIDAVFTITGLDSGRSYDIETYNTRNNSHYVTDVSIGAVTRVITTDTNYATPAVFTGLSSATGTIVITLHREGDFHYINGFQITELGTGGASSKAGPNTLQSNLLLTAGDAVLTDDLSKGGAQGFPNPFIDFILYRTKFATPQTKILVSVTDLAGRNLYTQSFSNIPQGNWEQRLDLSGKHLAPGVYMLRVTGIGIAKPITLKLLKK